MTSRIELLVVDDCPVVRKGIRSRLAKQEHFEIVDEAVDGREAVRKIRELRPAVVLMDINMPQMSGLAVTELLRRQLPKIKVLILSVRGNTDYFQRMIQSGAHGYVPKDASTEELVRAIETVNSGETYFRQDVERVVLNQNGRGKVEAEAPQLTARELEVLVHIADGLSNKKIASLLGVGVRTVDTHRESLMRKLDIHSAAGLTRFAIAKGLVSIGAELVL